MNAAPDADPQTTRGSGRIGACAYCRSKKIRCTGEQPTCSVCAKHDIQCSYPEHVSRKRKDRRLAAREARAAKKAAAAAAAAAETAAAAAEVGAGFGAGVTASEWGTDAAHAVPLGVGLDLGQQSANLEPGTVSGAAPAVSWNTDPLSLPSLGHPEWFDLDSLEQLLAMDVFGEFSATDMNAQPLSGDGGNSGPMDEPAGGLPDTGSVRPSAEQRPSVLAGTASGDLPSTAATASSPKSASGSFRVPYFRRVHHAGAAWGTWLTRQILVRDL